MKIRITLPSDEHFFQRYAALAPTLNKLGWMAQVVSALTEVGILFALIRNAVADIAPPVVAAAAGAAGAVLGTAFIEIGLRKFLPYSFRQILYSRFSGLDLVMSIAIISATVLLLGASGTLSFFGSKNTVEVVMPEAKKGEVVVGLYDDLKAGEYQMFRADSAAIAARYAPQFSALQAAHKASADAATTKLKNLEAKERNTGQSFATQKAGIKQSIADAAAAHAVNVADLQAQQAAELKARQDKRDAGIGKVDERLDRAFQTEEMQYAAAQQKRQSQVKAWGGSVAWFTVLCLFVLILSLGLQEVHRKGAGMQEEVLPSEYEFREDVVSSFFSAIKERWLSSAHAWIKEFEDGTPDPPEPGKPPVVYEYEQKVERRPIGFKADTEGTSNGHLGFFGKGHPQYDRIMSEMEEMQRRIKEYEKSNSPTRLVAYETRIDRSKLKNCVHCNSEFMPNHRVQKYCSEICRQAAWELRNGRKPYLKKGGGKP